MYDARPRLATKDFVFQEEGFVLGADFMFLRVRFLRWSNLTDDTRISFFAQTHYEDAS